MKGISTSANARDLLLIALLALTGCARAPEVPQPDAPTPPLAEKRPYRLEIHGDSRVDHYYWLRDDARKDPEMLAYLEAENRYSREVLAHTEPLQERLYQEITGRLKSEDRSVPVKRRDYLYYREYREGGEYPLFVRSRVDGSGPAEVMLDANELAREHAFYEIADWAVSSGQDLLAYSEDTLSRRQYTIRVKDLKSGELLPDRILNTSGDVAWANDNRTLFYIARDPQTLLPYRVYRHRLGDDPSEDKLVYEEQDDTFYTSLYKTRSRAYVVIFLSQTLSTEALLIDADRPDAPPVSFLPREPNHEYELHHIGDTFFVRTNWGAENFRLMRVKEGQTSDKRQWEEVIPHRDEAILFDVEVFDRYLVLNERERALSQITVIDRETGARRRLDFDDPVYSATLDVNPEPDSDRLRYRYTSLRIPESVYELEMATGYRTLLKREEVVGRFDPADYRTERLWAPARDGAEVPISLVYRNGFTPGGGSPLYVYGYGSYGISSAPVFRSKRLSLLDRGFVFAIIHVRGGEELGRRWYKDGKMMRKKNTFNDFIDATRYLVDEGYGDRRKVFAAGGSAGGLLMGVIANEAPELFSGGIIAHVPFVDVVTTMLDETIPLTTGEFDEWGDPRFEEHYDYMLSYSPYDQVKAQHYPNMLVTTGLYDSQVQYFEPVKWVAKLRAHKQDDNRLVIDIDMESGHGGASGRYKQYRLDALEYAFILDILGIEE